METLHQNIHVCHQCEHLDKTGAHGIWPCKSDPEKTHFIELAINGKCPLGKFDQPEVSKVSAAIKSTPKTRQASKPCNCTRDKPPR